MNEPLTKNATRPISILPPFITGVFFFIKIKLSLSDVSSEGQDEIMLAEWGC